MKGKPAKVLAVILISFKAGLRAGEIAAFKWDMVIDVTGRVGRLIDPIIANDVLYQLSQSGSKSYQAANS